MRIKTNLNVGFIVISEAVATNELARKNLTSDVADGVLHIVLTRAEEIASDPSGEIQNVQVEAIFPGLDDTKKLPEDFKRALVILGTYPLVSRSFHAAAQETHDQKETKLAQHATSADEGFETTFQEFKAATFILRLAEASLEAMEGFDPHKLSEPNPTKIGKYVATVIDQQLSKR